MSPPTDPLGYLTRWRWELEVRRLRGDRWWRDHRIWALVSVLLGVVGLTAGMELDRRLFWEDRPFLTNLTSSLVATLFGLPLAVVVVSALLERVSKQRAIAALQRDIADGADRLEQAAAGMLPYRRSGRVEIESAYLFDRFARELPDPLPAATADFSLEDLVRYRVVVERDASLARTLASALVDLQDADTPRRGAGPPPPPRAVTRHGIGRVALAWDFMLGIVPDARRAGLPYPTPDGCARFTEALDEASFGLDRLREMMHLSQAAHEVLRSAARASTGMAADRTESSFLQLLTANPNLPQHLWSGGLGSTEAKSAVVAALALEGEAKILADHFRHPTRTTDVRKRRHPV